MAAVKTSLLWNLSRPMVGRQPDTEVLVTSVLASQAQWELRKISDHPLLLRRKLVGTVCVGACVVLGLRRLRLTRLLLPTVLPNPRTLQLRPRLAGPAVRWPVAQPRRRQRPAPISSLSAWRTVPPAPALTLCAEVSDHLSPVPSGWDV